jgi:hypothetical protein
MNLNGGDDTTKVDRACIYAEQGTNAGKLTISHNKINHNETGQVPIILKGDSTKPQNAFIVTENDLLVNGATSQNWQIILYDAPNSRVLGNQIRPVNDTHPLIKLNDSENVVVNDNYLRGGTYGIEGQINHLVKASDNIFDSQATGKINAANLTTTNNRTWVARFSSAGVYGSPDDHTAVGWTVANPSTGRYTITHDIGDANFSVNATIDTVTTPGDVISVVRSTTEINIYVMDVAGVLVQRAVLVEVTLPIDNEYIY